ncbi:acetylxylan esterase [bacterium]|nr:acetylxylan esterase [bacterium]
MKPFTFFESARVQGRSMALSIFVLCMLVFIGGAANAQDDLSVLKTWKAHENAQNALYNLIASESYRFLDARDQTLAGIRSVDQYTSYTTAVHRKLDAAFGPLPAKTPLNVRVTGTIEREGIAVEKIVYESRPGFWVTGAVFKSPNAPGRLPAVLYVCGHTVDGFRSEAYQQVILNLARKGFLVFAIDPAGQGERLQYVDKEKGTSYVGGPTQEHSYAGLQYLFLGRTMAMVRLWDCIRAVDYLTARPDVDPQRIVVHGRSGGGTMSAFLGAMDTRIAAAAPECYITSFRRLLQSIGPQDAEQNLLGQISSGLDHGDFLVARDLKPTLVVTTTRDFFSIQGARETVTSLQAIPPVSASKSLSMVEDDSPHQSTLKNREAVYRFFLHTFGMQSNYTDETITPISPDLLRVTKTGQAVTSGSKTIHDLIAEDAVAILGKLQKNRMNTTEYASRIRGSASGLSGYRSPGTMKEPVFCGRFNREDYTIEKYILDGEDGLPLPVLLFVPTGGGRYPAILYVNPAGKQTGAEPGGQIEDFVRKGYCVCSPDLPGFGELAVDTNQGDSVIGGVSYNIIFGAQLIGRSITGIQASHIARACVFLKSLDCVVPERITGIGVGIAGPALLHAAVLDSHISALALIDSPVSWESAVTEERYDQTIGSTVVPSALTAYDLIDLFCVFAPGKVLVYNPVDCAAKSLPQKTCDRYTHMLDTFCGGGKNRFSVMSGTDSREALTGWLQNGTTEK